MKKTILIALIVLVMLIPLVVVVVVNNASVKDDPINNKLTVSETIEKIIIPVTENYMSDLVTWFQAFGYMSSIPNNYGEVREKINSNSYIELLEDENIFASVFCDDESYCFFISEMINGDLEPKGIVFIERNVYNENKKLIEEVNKITKSDPRFCLVSPSLFDNYDVNTSYIFTLDGLVGYRFDKSNQIKIISPIDNIYIEKIISFLSA